MPDPGSPFWKPGGRLLFAFVIRQLLYVKRFPEFIEGSLVRHPAGPEFKPFPVVPENILRLSLFFRNFDVIFKFGAAAFT
jgi:hypothetical protein